MLFVNCYWGTVTTSLKSFEDLDCWKACTEVRRYRHSRGSLYELIDQLITSRDEGYISEDDYLKGRELISKALALLNGYINYLAKSKNQLTSNK